MSDPPRPTRFEPSEDDPRIVAAMAARARLDTALAVGDVQQLSLLWAEDLVLQTPGHRVVDRAKILAMYSKGGQATYQGGLTLVLDFVGLRGGQVVMMGEERVDPPAPASSIRRRFTDVWIESGGAWKLLIRQATNIQV